MIKKKRKKSLDNNVLLLEHDKIFYDDLLIANQNIYNKVLKYLIIDKEINFITNFKISIKNSLLLKSSVTKFIKLNNIDEITKDYKNFLIFLKDKKCIPFWNDNIKNISKNIFLPVDKNLIKIENNKTFKSKTWFNNEHYITNEVLNSIEINNNREYTNDIIIKSKKIKLLLNSCQKKALEKMIGVYRYFYNRAISYINNYNKETKQTFYKIDFKDDNSIININLENEDNIFSMYCMRKLLKDNKPNWIDINVPSHLIDLAFKEASKNFSTCISVYKKNHKPFNMTIKTKKNNYQTFNIEKTMFSKDKKTLFKTLKYDGDYVFKKIKFSENLNKYNICDSSISYNRILKEFYLNLNYNYNPSEDIKNKKENLDNKKVCSIDPGLRCFLTIYSDNKVEKIGIGINNKIEKVCNEIDILTSRIYLKDKNNKQKFFNKKRTRINMKKALHRKIKYLKNLKEELHNKSIRHLVDNYGKIILPPFETQEMSKKFNSKISRALYNVSFYSFKEKLLNKCKDSDIKVIIRQEYYTSKTCTICGFLKHDLGSNKVYKCDECKTVIDRDINGARNIMLRNHEWEIPPLASKTIV